MKYLLTISLLFLFGNVVLAQNDKALIKDGNDAYKKQDYEAAFGWYNKALEQQPDNSLTQYNLGNTLYRAGKADDAVAVYDKAATGFSKPEQKSNALYNKGVVLQNNKKIEECIEAYKSALRLTPNDDDARQNLQKALKKQKEEEQKQDKDKDKKDKDKDKDKDQKQQPKPQPSKLSQKDAADKLEALMQQEKKLQDKLHKGTPQATNQPEKDW